MERIRLRRTSILPGDRNRWPRVCRPLETPAKEKIRLQDERQQAAVQAIADDPNVRALQEKFNARVNPASIRPKV